MKKNKIMSSGSFDELKESAKLLGTALLILEEALEEALEEVNAAFDEFWAELQAYEKNR